MILVLGATGTVGGALVRLLQQAGVPWRALVRSPERARTRLGSGAALVQGDLEQPETLPPALEGVERLFLASPVNPRQVAWQTEAIEAARRAGVHHVVKLSNLGADRAADFPVARWHGEIEAALEASGLAWTHLRPHFFMQNLLGQAATLRAEGVLRGAYGQGRISLVDARDVAAVAFSALTQPGHAGCAYALTGPEALSFAGIARALGGPLGRRVRYEALSGEAARRRLLAEGRPAWYAEALLVLFAGYARGEYAAVSDAVERVTGRPATPFARFLADHAERLRGAGAGAGRAVGACAPGTMEAP